MNAQDTSSKETERPATTSSGGRFIKWMSWLFVLAIAIAVALYFYQPDMARQALEKIQANELEPLPQLAETASDQSAAAPETLPAPEHQEAENNEVQFLKEQIASLTDRVNMLEEQVQEQAYTPTGSATSESIGILPGTWQPEADIALLTPDNSAVSGRIAALEVQIQRMQDSGLNEDKLASVLAMQDQLAAVNEAIATGRTQSQNQAQLLLAYDRLEKNMHAGEPFGHSLEALRMAAREAGDSAIWASTLAPHQQSGVPTMDELKADFDRAVQRYTARQETQPNDIWEAVWKNMSGLVSIRKVGGAHVGEDSGSRIARAEAALLDNNPNVALEEISALPESDKNYFSDWLDQASARQQALQALQSVEQRITSMVEYQSAPAAGE